MKARLFLILALATACDANEPAEDGTQNPTGKADTIAPCCDLADDPGGPEGTYCCADGSWVEDLGSNDPSLCDPVGGLGEVCEPEPACCDPADDPGGPEGTHCCADGSWVEDLGSGDPSLCDPYGGQGEVCEAKG